MRWNPNKTGAPFSSSRPTFGEIASRVAPWSVRQRLSNAAWSRSWGLVLAEEDDEERLIDGWLRRVSCPTMSTRPAPPGDFTARVMARIDAGPVIATPSRSRAQSNSTAVERLCVVGGAFGISALLVVTTCLLAVALAPNAVLALLNMAVGALVSIVLLLGPILDALSALITSEPFMLVLVALVAGALLLWSRVLRPTARLAGEA